jgi:hypothetical protein
MQPRLATARGRRQRSTSTYIHRHRHWHEKSTTEDLGSNTTRLPIREEPRATRTLSVCQSWKDLRREADEKRRKAVCADRTLGHHGCTNANGFHALSCCLRQSTWLARRRCRRGGTGIREEVKRLSGRMMSGR